MRREELLRLISTESDAITFCFNNNLLNKHEYCFICEDEMKLSLGNKEFRCQKRDCDTRISLLSNSIFEKSKLPVRTIILLVYEWSVESKISKVCEEYELSQSTVTNWYKKFRLYASYFNNLFNNEPIGGEGKIVEIDESLITKNKYHRGRKLASQQWIFGGVERGSSNCFIEIIEKRDRRTLLEILKRRVRVRSIIASDSWAAYRDLEAHIPELEATHYVVNHKNNFINPENHSAHTQTIEGFWSLLKRKLRVTGGTRYGSSIESYFGDFLYRRGTTENIFEKFIKDCAEFI